jgi:hypothetical protein
MIEYDDATVAAGVRAFVAWWLRGTLDDIADLADEILTAEQTGFPWWPAMDALAQQPKRRLWRALDDDTLQDLYDMSNAAGMLEAASAFAATLQARPYIDDGRIPREVRELVMERDGRRCRTCGRTDDLTLDHKYVPWSDGGSSTDPDNLQVLCRPCNSSKGRRPWVDEEPA